MNDNGGVVEAGVMSEDEEDHVGCKGEGCPNKCASGVDDGHVEEAVGGCGGVGQDVGGVVHGVHCSNRRKTKGERLTSRIQFLNLEFVRCANPGPCSSQPQGHKQLPNSDELDAQYV